jgi:predicted site-specific integrase-resolvase
MHDDNPRFTPQAAAEYLDVAPGTLAWWRWKGSGPAYEKASGRVRYRKSALDRFLADGTVVPEHQLRAGGKAGEAA